MSFQQRVLGKVARSWSVVNPRDCTGERTAHPNELEVNKSILSWCDENSLIPLREENSSLREFVELFLRTWRELRPLTRLPERKLLRKSHMTMDPASMQLTAAMSFARNLGYSRARSVSGVMVRSHGAGWATTGEMYAVSIYDPNAEASHVDKPASINRDARALPYVASQAAAFRAVMPAIHESRASREEAKISLFYSSVNFQVRSSCCTRPK